MMQESRYPFRYETHCHSCWCSGCGQNTPQEMAQAYYSAGYAGMILTDHFLRGNSCVDRSLPWEAQMARYWEAAQAAAQGAENSKQFVSKFGRAKSYGEKTIGTPDAGAMSMSYFFQGLAQA